MKIQPTGLLVSEIGEIVPQIEADEQGHVRFYFRPLNSPDVVHTAYVSPAEFDAMMAAFDVIKLHVERARELTKTLRSEGRPIRIEDRSGDIWEWRDDHGSYVMLANGHDEECEGDCGTTLKWIEANWGPVKILKRT